MKSLPRDVLLFGAAVVVATVLADCEAYMSEAAIKKTQQMLKTVCIKKNPVEESVLQNLKTGVFADDNSYIKCYFGCAFKTMQLVSPKGTIEKKTFKDKMGAIAPPSVMEIYTPVIEECTGKDKGDVCQNTYDFIKCAYHVDPRALDLLPV